jgi:hypothetical protein
MNKVIKDGFVAVLYSPGYGAGWYTWHQIPELIYDPAVVDMVERKVSSEAIIQYCEEKYPSFTKCYLGAEDLQISWIKEFRVFIINEYDGNESIQFREDINWLVA